VQHALRYQGDFDRNFEGLRPGVETYRGSDDAEQRCAPWPTQADGLRLGYMEKSGKNFFVVSVHQGGDDVVLRNPVHIDPPRHLGYGPRLGAEPTVIHDEPALELFDAIMSANPEQRGELQAIRNRLPARPHRKFT
jgi:hypothetical protein